MTEKLIIKANTRTLVGKKAKNLRSAKLVPAVIYGPKSKSQNLEIAYNNLEKVYQASGLGSLVDLKIDDNPPIQVLIQDAQFNPKTDQFQHIDFYRIRKGEKLKTTVRLEFIGEAKVVKEQGAVLVKAIDEIDVECLPQDLPGHIEVDISGMSDFEDLIRVKDLKISEKVAILNHADDVVVSVSKPRAEEVASPVAPAEEVAGTGEKQVEKTDQSA